MKKKILLTKSILAAVVILIVSLILSIIFILLYLLLKDIPLLLIFGVLVICDILIIFAILTYNLNWLIITEKNIKVKTMFYTLKENKWSEINDIYIFDFENVQNIKAGARNIGGIQAYIPKKAPSKWIFIDEGSGESGENIFEYFIPQRKNLPIRLQYDEEIMIEIKRYYSKTIIEKTIH